MSGGCAALPHLKYPSGLPVLSFIKSEGSQPGWWGLPERQLQNLGQGELIVRKGSHYLHHTHQVEIAQELTRFLEILTHI